MSPDNNLETVVSKFLLDNAINAKHKDTIISHVRQSLNQEAAAQLEKQTDQSQSVAKEFTMSPMIEQPPSAKEQILAKIK